MASIVHHPMIRDGLATNFLRIQLNSWMPFHSNAVPRVNQRNERAEESGCNQIFETVVVTPHGNLSACCGLTLEHISEMRLGKLGEDGGMRDLYLSQADDFLKYWIHMDGPYQIIRRLIGDSGQNILKDVVHICQACAVLHKNKDIKEAMIKRYDKFIPEVMTRFALEASIKRKEFGLISPI